MKLRNNSFTWICIAITLFQFASSEHPDAILNLQYKVEQLIEHVLQLVHDFYGQLKAEHKCIPEDLPDKIMEALKNSIDCMDDSEKHHQPALVARRTHYKNFLKCYGEAKKEVHDIMAAIDVNQNYCPENMTEKTYQINVTTSYTKRFKINIKNGLEVSKVIESLHPEHELCLDEAHDDDYDDDDVDNSEPNDEHNAEHRPPELPATDHKEDAAAGKSPERTERDQIYGVSSDTHEDRLNRRNFRTGNRDTPEARRLSALSQESALPEIASF